jgi:hypothetical protein
MATEHKKIALYLASQLPDDRFDASQVMAELQFLMGWMFPRPPPPPDPEFVPGEPEYRQ